MEIIPAVLPKNSTELRDHLKALPKEVHEVHLDILEEDIWTETDKELEVHIMAKDPRILSKIWAKRGVKRIIVHSLTPNILDLRRQVKLGLGVEMHVPLDKVLPLVSSVDFIQLMSIDKIGAQGRPFNPKVFDRIKEVKIKFPEAKISVDGGINTENFESLKELGVTRVIAGSGFKKLWSSQTKK